MRACPILPRPTTPEAAGGRSGVLVCTVTRTRPSPSPSPATRRYSGNSRCRRSTGWTARRPARWSKKTAPARSDGRTGPRRAAPRTPSGEFGVKPHAKGHMIFHRTMIPAVSAATAAITAAIGFAARMANKPLIAAPAFPIILIRRPIALQSFQWRK